SPSPGEGFWLWLSCLVAPPFSAIRSRQDPLFSRCGGWEGAGEEGRGDEGLGRGRSEAAELAPMESQGARQAAPPANPERDALGAGLGGGGGDGVDLDGHAVDFAGDLHLVAEVGLGGVLVVQRIELLVGAVVEHQLLALAGALLGAALVL